MISVWRLFAERVAAAKKQLQVVCEDTEQVEFQPDPETLRRLRENFFEAKAMLWAVADDLHEIARHHESLGDQHQFPPSLLLPDAEGGNSE